MMKDSGNCWLSAGENMMVNFKEIEEIAILVSDFGETLLINNQIVNKWTFGPFITNTFDA